MDRVFLHDMFNLYYSPINLHRYSTFIKYLKGFGDNGGAGADIAGVGGKVGAGRF